MAGQAPDPLLQGSQVAQVGEPGHFAVKVPLGAPQGTLDEGDGLSQVGDADHGDAHAAGNVPVAQVLVVAQPVVPVVVLS